MIPVFPGCLGKWPLKESLCRNKWLIRFVVSLARGLRRDCQLLLFSATYDEQVMKFAESIVHDAIVIKLRREEQSLDNIKQYYIECTSLEDKFSALSNIYASISIGQSMIFCHVRPLLTLIVVYSCAIQCFDTVGQQKGHPSCKKFGVGLLVVTFLTGALLVL